MTKESAQFNSRFQITQIGLGNSPTDTGLWKINYDYGELNPDGTTVDASKNIGQIAKQTITVPTTNFVQTFRYDAVNRLTEAKEATGGSQNWIQTFGYDLYGNRTQFSQNVGGNALPINNQTHPAVDPATNRFQGGQGYVYDFNGNIVQDAQNRGFTFNGDDKQSVVRDLNVATSPSNPDANVIGRYSYDGFGARVKKTTNTETTVFVFDGFGALAAEYSTVTAEAPTTSFLTTDGLGSPRMITDRKATSSHGAISCRSVKRSVQGSEAAPRLSNTLQAAPTTSANASPDTRKTTRPVSISPRPGCTRTNTAGSPRPTRCCPQ